MYLNSQHLHLSHPLNEYAQIMEEYKRMGSGRLTTHIANEVIINASMMQLPRHTHFIN